MHSQKSKHSESSETWSPSMLPSYGEGGRDDENLGQAALWEGGMGSWEEQEAEFAVVKVVHRSSLS